MDSWQELSCNFFPVENIHIHSFNPPFILFFFNRRKSNSVYPFVRFIPLDLCFDKKREREKLEIFQKISLVKIVVSKI